MNPAPDPGDDPFSRIEALRQALAAPAHPTADQIANGAALARLAIERGRADAAIPLLEAMRKARPEDRDIAHLLGFALRLEQRLDEAANLYQAALGTSPDDPALTFGLAQARYELGLPAARLFAAAASRAPEQLDLHRNHALALISEGNPDQAERLLNDLLARNPGWIDGLMTLATLKWTRGDTIGYASHFAEACKLQPANQPLWIAWFQLVAQARDWPAAIAILERAERALGPTPALASLRLFVAVEMHDDAAAEALLVQTAHIRGDVTNLCRVRHLLRKGAVEAAETLLLGLVAQPSANLFWPYLSLCWRLRGDSRAEWLDRPDTLIRAIDSGIAMSDLDDLAALLRTLHTAQAPYIEQSVRGGTQTDRSVLLRHEPIISHLRQRLIETIRAYVAALPPAEADHPLLGRPRGKLKIEGSWSVRLLKQGYNVPHTHPKGWLSTAFYVDLPAPSRMGPAPAGHIAFGTPPAELGLDLPAYRTIAPARGRLAIFPSTMWHGTVPFDDGERLVIAFDIRPPAF